MTPEDRGQERPQSLQNNQGLHVRRVEGNCGEVCAVSVLWCLLPLGGPPVTEYEQLEQRKASDTAQHCRKILSMLAEKQARLLASVQGLIASTSNMMIQA